MGRRVAGGASVGDHMGFVARITGASPILAPELPTVLIYLWNIFTRLHGTRPRGFSTGRITFSEIEAYSRVMGDPLLPWEVEVIIGLDDIYMAVSSEGA
jgi:hypothetical protein